MTRITGFALAAGCLGTYDPSDNAQVVGTACARLVTVRGLLRHPGVVSGARSSSSLGLQCPSLLPRALRVVSASAALCLLFSACADDGSNGQGLQGLPHLPKAPTTAVPIGSFRYDNNPCPVMYNGTFWEYYELGDGKVYCYKQIGQDLFDAYPLVPLLAAEIDHSRVSPAFRRDFSDESMFVFMPYEGHGLWRRQPYNDSYIEIFYNSIWMPIADYETELLRISAAESAAQQAANEASYAAAQQLLLDFKICSIEAAGAFLRPACASSYNGC